MKAILTSLWRSCRLTSAWPAAQPTLTSAATPTPAAATTAAPPAVPRTVTRPAMTAQTTMAMAILTALIGCQNSCEVTVCGSENSEEACSDGIDNDGDGRVDCEDATVELALRPVDQTRQHSSSAPMVSMWVVTVLQTAKTAIASNSLTLKAVIPAMRTPQKPAQTVSIMIMTPTLTAMT